MREDMETQELEMHCVFDKTLSSVQVAKHHLPLFVSCRSVTPGTNRLVFYAQQRHGVYCL